MNPQEAIEAMHDANHNTNSHGGEVEICKTVDPIGDTVVGVKVPADEKWHYGRINYQVGPGYRVVGCTLHGLSGAPGITGERDLRVETAIL
jgi:hypothetical protein